MTRREDLRPDPAGGRRARRRAWRVPSDSISRPAVAAAASRRAAARDLPRRRRPASPASGSSCREPADGDREAVDGGRASISFSFTGTCGRGPRPFAASGRRRRARRPAASGSARAAAARAMRGRSLRHVRFRSGAGGSGTGVRLGLAGDRCASGTRRARRRPRRRTTSGRRSRRVRPRPSTSLRASRCAPGVKDRTGCARFFEAVRSARCAREASARRGYFGAYGGRSRPRRSWRRSTSSSAAFERARRDRRFRARARDAPPRLTPAGRRRSSTRRRLTRLAAARGSS